MQKKITKKKLQNLYWSMKTEDLAKELKISVPTLLTILAKQGIELKGKSRRVTKGDLLIKK